MRWLVRIVGAALAGVLLALAFPPTGWWPLAPISVALFTATVLKTRWWQGFLLGSAYGVSSFLILLSWITVIGSDAWVALSLFSGLWVGLIGMSTALVTRLPGWPIWVAVVWVGVEAVRDRIPLGGWPWGRLGFSQADATILPLASWGGMAALTAAAAVIGALLVGVAISFRAVEPTHLVGAIVAIPAVLLLPLLIPLPTTGESDQGPPSATIAIVQGDVPKTGLGFTDGGRAAVLDNHVEETLRLAERVASGSAPQPEAVIWPENASDLDPYTDEYARERIDLAAKAIKAPILVGAVITNPDDPDTVWNVGIVWDPKTGPGQRYVKQHPVPFGEYIPFRDLVGGFTDRFELIPRDFAAGDSTGVLDVGPVRMGDVICFEIAYDDLVRETVQAGARMLTVQTNNATYTGSGQTEQQLAMSRIRSVEHGRTVAVAATNGISALFAPNGELVQQIPESTAASIVSQVPLRDTLSWSDRLSWLPEALAVIVWAALLVLGSRRPLGVWPLASTETKKAKGPSIPVATEDDK